MTKPHMNFDLKPMRCVVKGRVVVEKWVYISGYDGIYKVSTFGRLKAMKRDIVISYGAIRHHKTMIMKQSVYKAGYLYIQLPIKKQRSGKRYRHYKIHILVAKAFIPNPSNKPHVNHKKGNKKDNRVWMLEWNTQQENVLHSFKTGLKKASYGGSAKYRMTTEKVAEIKELKAKGLTFNKISKRLNISLSTVKRHYN